MYKYTDRLQSGPKQSFVLSEYLNINWQDPHSRHKYKRVMEARMHHLRSKIDQLTHQTNLTYHSSGRDVGVSRALREDWWAKLRHVERIQPPL